MLRKMCISCKIEKSIEDFYRDSSQKDGRDFRCKECSKARNKLYYKEYYQKHRESKIQKSKQYRENNKDKVREAKKEYRIKNLDKISSKMKEYYEKNRESLLVKDAERKRNNPQAKLAAGLRSRLRRAIKNKYKSGSAVSDLGCSITELMKHLESKFLPNMSWDNYGAYRGGWTIDHIIPLSAFDLTDRQHVILACYYLNLCPLWYEDNISKGFRY